jgi:peptidoglycan/xylan/chitin deacetylase (PgdA/CDA1 family)
VACVHGDTSTTMAQPIEAIGEICRRHDALLYVDATATLGGMSVPVDAWQADIVTAGLQKCLGGPSGSAPITISDRAAEHIFGRRHVEARHRHGGAVSGNGRRIASNYFDLAMIMDYWSDKRLNHHTEAASMLYAARECARVVLEEGLEARFARHAAAGAAVVAGVEALGLKVYGDQGPQDDQRHRRGSPAGVDYDRVKARMRTEFEIEIGAAFGPLAGKIWRIGAMGVNARKHAVLTRPWRRWRRCCVGKASRAWTAGRRRRRGGEGVRPHDLSPRPHRLRRAPAPRPVAQRRPRGRAVRAELRGRRRAVDPARRPAGPSEFFLSEMVGAQPIPGMRNMSMESLYEYGSRAGFWRIRRLFEEFGLPLTVYRRRPGHGAPSRRRRGDDEVRLGDRQPRLSLDRLPALHPKRRSASTSPRPSRSRGPDRRASAGLVPGPHQPQHRAADRRGRRLRLRRRQLCRRPALLGRPARPPQLIVPYTLEANDMRFTAAQGFNTGEQFFTYLRDAFDALYLEGETAPKMMSIGLHCRIVGKPGRIMALRASSNTSPATTRSGSPSASTSPGTGSRPIPMR